MTELSERDQLSECDQFPFGSRQRQVCRGESELSIGRTNRFRERFGLTPLVGDPAAETEGLSLKVGSPNVVRNHRNGVTSTARRGCCGDTQAKTEAEVAVVPVVSRRPAKKSLIERTAKFAFAMAKHLADDNAATVIDDVVFRKSCCATCQNNVKDTCSLCDCPLSKNVLNNGKLAWRSENCPAGRWFRQTNNRRPLVEPTKNMIFHVYPKLGVEWNWHWHIAQIRRHAAMFNGKICIAIVTGDDLADPDAVQRLFDGVPVTDWVIRQNVKSLGETTTFVDLLRLVETDDPNTVTFRGHTKGVTHRRDGIEQPWARMMWETCMDWPSCNDALASHVMAGPMKCHEPLVANKYWWFFAGTFFWFRNKEIFQNPNWSKMEQTKWYPEAWPNVLCDNKDAACLFYDFTERQIERHWPAFEAEFEKWCSARSLEISDVPQP